METTYPDRAGHTGRFFYDLVFPGYMGTETPQSISARFYAALVVSELSAALPASPACRPCISIAAAQSAQSLG